MLLSTKGDIDMKKIISFFVAISLLALTSKPLLSATLKTMPITIGSGKIKSYEKSPEKVRWESEISTAKAVFNKKPFIYTEEKGKGIFGKDNTYKSWITRGYYEIKNGELIPYEVKTEIKDKSGKIVFDLVKSYNLEAKKIVCKINGKTKILDFHQNTIDRDIIGRVLSNFPFESGEDVKFFFVTHEPTLYLITMKNHGKETITYKGNNIECYKLELIPDLGALGFVGAFVPKTYFWYTVSAPHEFIRYEGLESGLGTPVIIMENAN